PVDAAGSLLRFLVARGGHVATEEASEALWPEVQADRAAARLRNALYRVRRQWGDIIVRDGHMLRWAPDVVVDTDVFEREAAAAIASGELAMMQSAERWYRGELLPAARYNDWAAVPRERLQRRYARLLVAIAEAAEEAGD